MIRNRLREESYATARGPSGAPVVFVDEDDFPGAVSPSGDYTMDGKKVRATVVLTKDNQEIAYLEVEGLSDALEALAERVVQETERAVSH